MLAPAAVAALANASLTAPMPPAGRDTPPVVPLATPESRCRSVTRECMTVPRQHGVVGTRRKVGAEHCIEGQRGLQRRRFERLFDHVEDIDTGDAHELAHVVATEAADVPAQEGGADEIGTATAEQSRRNAVVLLAEHARELEHGRVMRGQCGAIGIADATAFERAAIQHQVLVRAL